jgi:ATPase subunit of ABC transporter with duplicated ATPase domains
LEEPNLVLLDEPTNHLDLRAIEWLETFIKGAKSAVLVVSHDRYFLDAISDSIVELEDGKLVRYPGNYSKYVREKAARDEQLARRAKANAERREQLERFIEKPTRPRASRSFWTGWRRSRRRAGTPRTSGWTSAKRPAAPDGWSWRWKTCATATTTRMSFF